MTKQKESIVCCPPSGKCASQVARKNAAPIFLLCGTMSVILGKAMYQLESKGRDGKMHKFEKPWMVDVVMFLGMMVCLIGFAIERVMQKQSERQKITPKLYWVIAIPALCDAISTYLMNVGLLWVLSSIWQMLRGSIILFTALLKITYRKGKLYGYEWLGLFTVIVALATVGATAFFNQDKAHESSSSSLSSSSSENNEETKVTSLKLAVGIGLVIIAQFLQALQTIVEEKLLHDVEAPAVLIVGMEGLWGFLICAFVSMPVAQFLPGKDGEGIHEDSIDSFIMMSNSWAIIGILIAYVFFILLFNLYGMIITELTDAMLRNLMEPIRVLFIWLAGLFIHYVISDTLGESLSWWSFMELGGFIILAFGFMFYNAVIKLPCFLYPKKEEKQPLLPEKDDKNGTVQEHPAEDSISP